MAGSTVSQPSFAPVLGSKPGFVGKSHRVGPYRAEARALALEPGWGAPRLAREALCAWLAHDDLSRELTWLAPLGDGARTQSLSAFSELCFRRCRRRDAALTRLLAAHLFLTGPGADADRNKNGGTEGHGGGDQKRKSVPGDERARGLCGSGRRHRGQDGQPHGGPGLLASGEQGAGQALVTALDARANPQANEASANRASPLVS